LLPVFEQRLIGLRIGDKCRFEIAGSETRDLLTTDENHVLPRSDFPLEMKLEPGMVIAFETPSGAEAAGVVTEVSDLEVSVNFAHPLAGHDLVFEVEVLDIQPHPLI
jgi:FKBP-type peptidyl-prolyl cis-trans isomerase SlpA